MNLDVALCESIARVCGVPADQVSPASTLEDLGIDSLAAAEIITDVEIRTGIELPMDVLRGLGQLRTVGEVAAHLAGRRREPARPQRAMTGSGRLATMGTSPRAIMHHYDLSDDFFRIWLGPDMVYSCGWWEAGDGRDSLARAQHRKLDFFADRLGVRGGRVLDVGCGWGALLDRFVRVHGAASGIGLTLSPGQAGFAARRNVPGVSYQLQNWVDHEPGEPYDAVTCIEATEHFASETLSPDEKVEVYRAFFERAASWLRPGGRMGLQLICLDNVGHAGSRAGRGPFADLILRDIFPESMPASLSELVLGWETHFELDEFHDHPRHYQRTFRAWTLAYRQQEALARELVGPEACRTYARYFAVGEAVFRLREHSLYRVILTKRPEPKSWAVTVRPSDIPAPADRGGGPAGASAAAVRSHYDVSNSFYALWLGPSMMYSSAMWAGAEDPGGPRARPAAEDRLLRGQGAARPGSPAGPRRRLRLGLEPPPARRGAPGHRRHRADAEPGAARLPHPSIRSPGPTSGWRTGTTTNRASRTTRSSRSARSSTSPGTGRQVRNGLPPTAVSSARAWSGWPPEAGSRSRRSRTTAHRTPTRPWAGDRWATSC